MKKILLILLFTIIPVFSQDKEIISLEDIYISIINSANIKIPEDGKDFTKEEKEIIKVNTLNFLISVYNEYYIETKSYEKSFIKLLSYLGYVSNIKFKHIKGKNYEISFYVDKDLEYKYLVYFQELLSLILGAKYGNDVKAKLVLYSDIQLKKIKK